MKNLEKILYPIISLLSLVMSCQPLNQNSNQPLKNNSKIITIAGGGVGDNSLATTTNLSFSYSIALDNNGNIYVTDPYNYRIRKIDQNTRIISTVAGRGYAGDRGGDESGDGGLANSATLYKPSEVVIDNNGNIFILDSRIRKVDKVTGIISTIAGNGIDGVSLSDDSDIKATSANLMYPEGLSVDNDGNVYIIERGKIKKIDKESKMISTIASNTTTRRYPEDGELATSGDLNPKDMVIDTNGDIYFSNGSNQIRKIDNKTGVLSTIAGTRANNNFESVGRYSGDGGQATLAELASPIGLTIDTNGDIFFADRGNDRIRKIDKTSGIISTVAGNGTRGNLGDNGPATSANLELPMDVKIDKSGNIYISETYSKRVRMVNKSTGIISTVIGNGSKGFLGEGVKAETASLNRPMDVKLDKIGNIYIADTENNRIRKINRETGKISTVVGDGYDNGYTTTGRFSGDNGPATLASLNNPTSIAIDDKGVIYIADTYNNRIRKVDQNTGIISTIAGNGNDEFSGDGQIAIKASLCNPKGVALDSSQNIYISDNCSSRIRKIDKSTGIISTVAGNGTGFSSFNSSPVNEGQAISTSVAGPSMIAIGSDGNLYIADTLNNRIRKLDTSTGYLNTEAGYGGWGSEYDNFLARDASVYVPYGIALDKIGNIFITNLEDNTIRKVDKFTGRINIIAGDDYRSTSNVGRFNGDKNSAISTSLFWPKGLTVDNNGDIYFADTFNNRIRKIVQN